MKHIKMFRAALAALVTVVLTSQLQAADIFVSPTGSGDFSGSSWSNAINGNEENLLGIKVRTVITDAVAADAEEVNVYFASGEYVTTNQITLSSITIPVKLSGGYVGETDGSFDRSETATTFKRSTYNIRFISATSLSSFVVDGITFTGGYINESAGRGGAIFLNSSNTIISNSVFISNKVNDGTNGSSSFGGGGAVAAVNGSLILSKCKFQGNCREAGAVNNASGGAVYARNTEIEIKDSDFVSNYLDCVASRPFFFGGAIGTYYGNVTISNCTFNANYIRGCSNSGGASAGALAIRNAKKFKFVDSVVKNCYVANNASLSPIYHAGVMYLDDWLSSDGVMTSVVERCVFDLSGVPNTIRPNAGSTQVPVRSDIKVFGGHLFMTNCLIAGVRGNHGGSTNSICVCTGTTKRKNFSGYAYYTSGNWTSADASIELVNCTIADGKANGANCLSADAELKLKNCIVYGNKVTDIINPTSVEYSCLQNDHVGTENFIADPQWTGAPYYHLLTKNTNGAITNGWFFGTFESAKTSADSPCIDAGAPGSLGLDLEPYYSGRRVNIGAYGGTPWASKTSPLPGFKLIIR